MTLFELEMLIALKSFICILLELDNGLGIIEKFELKLLAETEFNLNKKFTCGAIIRNCMIIIENLIFIQLIILIH